MTRTRWLQETRMIRFEEAYEGWQHQRLTQQEAARLLGVCERSFRRYVVRYEDGGIEALIDQRLEQISHRRAPVKVLSKCETNLRNKRRNLRSRIHAVRQIQLFHAAATVIRFAPVISDHNANRPAIHVL